MPAFNTKAYLCSIGMLASVQDGECGIRICFFHSFILHFNMAGGAGNSPEYHTMALQLYITSTGRTRSRSEDRMTVTRIIIECIPSPVHGPVGVIGMLLAAAS